MTKNKPNLFSRKNLARSKKQAGKMLRRIKNAHNGGKKKLRDRLIVQYLQSMDARVLAVLEAYHALRPSRRPSKKQLPSIAEAIRPWQASDEPVVLSIRTKSNGGHRPIMNFRICQRARQYLVASVLKAVADLHPDQYATRGGAPAAIDRVITLLQESYEWITETDIKNCFPSCTGTNLDKYIPLQQQVIDKVILANHLKLTYGDNLKYHFGLGSAGEDDPGDPVAFSNVLSDAQQGIPQGSAVASIAVEILLAQPLKSLPIEAKIVCYADNMLVMQKSQEEAASVTSALWSALAEHPVGHLTPKLKSQSIPGQPFEFLGHQITRTNTSISITPSLKNEAKFASRFKTGLAAISNPVYSTAKRKIIADDLRHFIEGWTASFSRCDGMANRKKACLRQVQKALVFAHKMAVKKSSQNSQPVTLSP